MPDNDGPVGRRDFLVIAKVEVFFGDDKTWKAPAKPMKA